MQHIKAYLNLTQEYHRIVIYCGSIVVHQKHTTHEIKYGIQIIFVSALWYTTYMFVCYIFPGILIECVAIKNPYTEIKCNWTLLF